MVLALIAVAVVCGAVALLLPRFARTSAIVLACVALAVWIARFVEVAHLPLFGTYENALSVALATSLAGIRWPRAAGATSLIAALILVQGIRYDAMPYALTISERSLVVDLHAVLAWLAFAVFAAAFGLALTKHDALLERTLLLGFVLHTAMIATGSLYKFMLFGKVWSFDPIETMALVAWLVYGTLIHLPRLAGWSARRVARWTFAAFALLLVSYRAIIYFPPFATYHIFDIGLKLHR